MSIVNRQSSIVNVRPRRFRLMASGGFTLLELIITLVLFAVMVGVMSYTYYIAMRSWGYELNRLEAKTEPTIAAEQFWKDLEPNTNNAGAVSMVCAGTQQIRFATTTTCGFAASCITSPMPACVTEYRWDGVNRRFIRTVGAQPLTVANRISSVTFSYYDASGGTLAAPVPVASLPNIRTIQLDLQGQKTYLFATETFDLRNQVSPRNLK